MAQTLKKIAIVGAGFGGLAACKKLAKNPQFEIHLIDRRNYHLFQPLLYQVAMAGLNPSEIATPIRKLVSRFKNVIVTMSEVENVSTEDTALLYDKKWYYFDSIILACGAKHFYFGNNEWEQFAPGLKNIEQATEIRRRILTAFEMAEKQSDENLREEFLTFAVVGGGPTGVELAGAIAEMASKTLKYDYKLADLSKTKVILIEAGPRVLAAFPEALSLQAEKDLKKMGVTIMNNARASDLSDKGLRVGDLWIPSRTLIWAAGVKPSSLSEKVVSAKDKQGRIFVEKDLSLEANKNIFVIGDQCSFLDSNGNNLPGIAPVAIQQGQFVARTLIDDVSGKTRSEFSYFDKGIMATIGRSKAVVSSGRFKVTGFMAWLIWVFIHVLYLMQFKNRFFVFLQWTWAYFNFGRGARLIVQKSWRFYSGKKINYENQD